MEYKVFCNKINEITNEFTERFGCRAMCGPDFMYCPGLDLIFYELDFSCRQKYTRDFLQSVKRQKPRVRLNSFVWAILHELGHHATNDDLTEEEERYCDRKRARIMRTKAKHPYYNLPDEVMATAWAVDYANTHTDEVREFSEKLLAVLYEAKGTVVVGI